MGDDARGTSLSARVTELEAIVRSQQENMRQLERELAEATEAEAIIRRARFGVPPRLRPPEPPQARHRRDRHGLRIVSGSAAAALMWLAARGHRVAAAATGLVLATGMALTPGVFPSHPAQAAPHRPLGRAMAVRRLPSDPPAVPMLTADRHHRAAHGDSEEADEADQAAVPVPTPTPTPTVPVPVPTPTVAPPTPVPSPPVPVPAPAASAPPLSAGAELDVAGAEPGPAAGSRQNLDLVAG